MERTALVTGGNRGLGRETCRQLAEAGFRVVLSARTAAKADEAARDLGDAVLPLALDVTSEEDVRRAASELRRRVERIDVLVNNAGVALRGFDVEVVRETLAVNVFGAIRVADHAVPLLRGRGRIVNVSSGMGDLSILGGDLAKRFADPNLSREGLRALLAEFEACVQQGIHRRHGWPSSAYGVSKVALNAFTRILARELRGTAILVNSVCPGWVRTSMGGPSAPRDVAAGARSIVYAATLPERGPTGAFFRDGRRISF